MTIKLVFQSLEMEEVRLKLSWTNLQCLADGVQRNVTGSLYGLT